MLSELLFEKVSAVEPYPPGVRPVPEQLPGLGFFPGGRGVWVSGGRSEPMPFGKVMILGQDFHSYQGYEASRKKGGESPNSPTWKHLLGLLSELALSPGDCFFTNAYMGLRDGPSATGKFIGARDKGFVQRCRSFFQQQLIMQRPRLIAALGVQVVRFLVGTSRDLESWKDATGFGYLDDNNLAKVDSVHFGTDDGEIECTVVALTHPSFRPRNVGRRRYGDAVGELAELKLFRDSLKEVGLGGLVETT